MALVVFDLDGTLIDSRRDLADSVNAMLAAMNRPALSVEAVTTMVGEGAQVLVRRALAASGAPAERPAELSAALARFLACYEERLLVHTRPYPGVPEMLAALDGKYRLALLTNKPSGPTRRILDRLDLLRFFERVLGGDSVLARKPDPAGLLGLMEDLGVSASETVLVGDSPIDLETARAAGVTPCLVAYGFGFPAGDAAPSGAVVAKTPGDVVGWLSSAALFERERTARCRPPSPR